ncbi:MAG: IS110 family transposase [Sulfuricaulis sp.]|nr:IS110 family transposase [Sulfuricaulis sp.]
MKKSSKIFVGMDVHKESIDITMAEAAGEVRRWGQIGGDRAALEKAVRKLESSGRPLHFVYEAGPCGFWIQRLIAARGHECWVVSPSLIPKKSGERIKTDRRDSEKIARMARAGELEPIYVPGEVDEAIRDLVRCRDDAIIAQRRTRQQLKALLLRNEIRYVGKSSWTAAHRQWIARLKLPQPAQQIAFEEYVDAVEVATNRVERITRAIERSTEGWRLAPVVQQLQALRGVQFVHAVTMICELGDLARFENPRQLMAYLGLVPTENSSGERRRQGAITKSGNRFARRALIEAAWAYQHSARVSPVIARRQKGLPKRARDIAWKAQLRLCARFRKLCARRLNKNKAVVAVARELAGFVWAIAKDVKIA